MSDISKWSKIIRDIEETGEYYEKINDLISFGYGDKLRRIIAENSRSKFNILDAGSGPGILSLRVFDENKKAYIIGLDASYDLAKRSLSILSKYLGRFDSVVGIFENPPFRKNVFDAVYSTYSIRDAIDIDEAIHNLSLLVKSGGIFMSGDIGKPDNFIIRILLKIYIKIIAPLIAALITRDLHNPWWGLGKTIDRIPRNSEIISIFKKYFDKVETDFYAFSTLYLLKGYKIKKI